MLKKILTASDPEKLRAVFLPAIDQLKSRGYKSRFLGLNMILDFVDPYLFIEQNPGVIGEVIESTIEAVTTGKYVLNFFETLLKKAMGSTLDQEQSKTHPHHVRVVQPLDQ